MKDYYTVFGRKIMGQCYLVEAKFIFKNDDPASFCKVFKDTVERMNGVTANFNLSYGDMDTPYGCFNILTGGQAYLGLDIQGNEHPDIWRSVFDASYGWEWVMYDVFSAILKECENGSKVKIWPDFGETTITVKDCEVKIV